MTDATPFSLTINGELRAFDAPPAHVEALVEALGLTAARVAVEVNRRIARRAAWSETPLESGDTVEIVHFVGGGA